MLCATPLPIRSRVYQTLHFQHVRLTKHVRSPFGGFGAPPAGGSSFGAPPPGGIPFGAPPQGYAPPPWGGMPQNQGFTPQAGGFGGSGPTVDASTGPVPQNQQSEVPNNPLAPPFAAGGRMLTIWPHHYQRTNVVFVVRGMLRCFLFTWWSCVAGWQHACARKRQAGCHQLVLQRPQQQPTRQRQGHISRRGACHAPSNTMQAPCSE